MLTKSCVSKWLHFISVWRSPNTLILFETHMRVRTRASVYWLAICMAMATPAQNRLFVDGEWCVQVSSWL